jgi:hypothetical protein
MHKLQRIENTMLAGAIPRACYFYCRELLSRKLSEGTDPESTGSRCAAAIGA